jgi:hypothetical protein
MQEALSNGTKRLKDCISLFGKNYVACIVSESLKPCITDAIMELLEETKAEVGMKGGEEKATDKIADVPADQSDLFAMDMSHCSAIHTAWYYTYTSYTLHCIRIGYKKDKFFALGRRYQVGYRVLQDMHHKLKKEQADRPPANLPPDCLHGEYCCCLKHKADLNNSQDIMHKFMADLSKMYCTSKVVPAHFYLGDNYEAEQRAHKVFETAFELTRAEVYKGAWRRQVKPFDEGEALLELLRTVAIQEICPEVRANNPLVKTMGARAYYRSDSVVLTAVDTAFQGGWPAVQTAVNKARDSVQAKIDEGAAKLVEALKPVVKKVLELVQSKMAKKEQKEESKEKKKPEIGDSMADFRFERTGLGGKFYNDLANEDTKAALQALEDSLDGSMSAHLEVIMKAGAKAFLGDRMGDFEIVQALMEKMAEVCVKLLGKYSTVVPLITSSKRLFALRSDCEANLKQNKANKEAALKSLDEISLAMWKELPMAGIALFREVDKIKEKVQAEMSDAPESAVEPLLEAADMMFAAQIKALNTARSQFISRLKTKFAEAGMLDNENTIGQTVRETFREVVFPLINIMVVESWKCVGAAYIVSAVEQGKAMFQEKIWPAIAAGLNELQNLIPESLTSMGLKIEPLALTLSNILLSKGINSAVTKLILAFEAKIFEQKQG